MAKTDPEAARRQRHKTIRWVVTVFLMTVAISGVISLVSDEVMDSSSLPVAFSAQHDATLTDGEHYTASSTA